MLDATDTEWRRPIAALHVGDRFVVRPGETVATDGEVIFGQSAIDRSAMTGESVPADVAVGDTVLGGTVCVGGRLVVRATKLGADTQLAQMLRLVEDAQNQKAEVQRLADRIAGGLCARRDRYRTLTLAGWLLLGGTNEEAFSAALSVLIIACPCALGLATPTALWLPRGKGLDSASSSRVTRPSKSLERSTRCCSTRQEPSRRGRRSSTEVSSGTDLVRGPAGMGRVARAGVRTPCGQGHRPEGAE